MDSNTEKRLEELLEEVRNLKSFSRLPTVLSKEDACRELGGISLSTLNRMIREGRLLTCALGRSGRGIPRTEIERIGRPDAPERLPPRGGKRGPKTTAERNSREEAIAIRALTKRRR